MKVNSNGLRSMRRLRRQTAAAAPEFESLLSTTTQQFEAELIRIILEYL